MTEAPRQPKPVTVTIEGEDPRDVQAWLKHIQTLVEINSSSEQFITTRLHPSSFVIQPKVVR